MLLNLPEIRKELNWSGQEGQLTTLIDAVEKRFESETFRRWSTFSSLKDVHRTRPSDQYIFCKHYPLTNVTLKEWSIGETEADGVDVPLADYYVTLSNGMIERLRSTSWKDFVQTSASGGYDPNNFPADIARAMVVQIRFLLARYAPDKLIVTSQSFESGSTSYVSFDLHPDFKAIIERNRRRV